MSFELVLSRLRRLVPPPVPSSGVELGRLQVAAKAILEADTQADLLEHQLFLAATVANAGLANSTVVAAPGASGADLDRWGGLFGVGRAKLLDGSMEPDARYALRILADIIRPSTTNLGLAQVLDVALQIQGTQVVDAGGAEFARVNDGMRFNDGGQFSGFTAAVDQGLFGTFKVIFPMPAYSTMTQAEVEKIIARRKPAGTRVLLVLAP